MERFQVSEVSRQSVADQIKAGWSRKRTFKDLESDIVHP